MKRRIYTDTSVIGGCLDAEFEEWSVALFDDFKSRSAILVISDLTLAELEAAPQSVRDVLLSVPAEHIEFLEFSAEAGSGKRGKRGQYPFPLKVKVKRMKRMGSGLDLFLR